MPITMKTFIYSIWVEYILLLFYCSFGIIKVELKILNVRNDLVKLYYINKRHIVTKPNLTQCMLTAHSD